MSKLIEVFKVDYDVTYQDGSVHTFHESLHVLEQYFEKDLIAYSFNSDSYQYCSLVADALKKYKRLKIETGVSGGCMHQMIQQTIRRHLEKILGDHLKIAVDETGYRFGCYTFEYID